MGQRDLEVVLVVFEPTFDDARRGRDHADTAPVPAVGKVGGSVGWVQGIEGTPATYRVMMGRPSVIMRRFEANTGDRA